MRENSASSAALTPPLGSDRVTPPCKLVCSARPGIRTRAWHSRRVARVALLAGWLALTLPVVRGRAAGAAPYIPAGEDVVLQTVPSTADPRVRAFEVLRRAHAERPRDLGMAVKLSMAYLDYGRDTGDARYLGRAAAVIAPWMSLRPVPIPALLVHATILQSKHYFAAARVELMSILQRQHDNVQAWLTLATVAQVQGDYKTARQSCSFLLSTGNLLIPLVCLSSLNAVTGRAASALRILRTLAAQARSQPPAVRSWMQGIMADTAKYLGDDAAADLHFRKALQLAPGDNFLLADYGDFLLDRHHPRAALDLVKEYSASDTSFLRQVYAEVALRSPRARADVARMAARFAAIDRRGTRAYRREEAGFVLRLQHDPQRALQLAQLNWTVQRAPKDMRVLLEAALAAHQPRAAQPVLDLLARSHFQYAAIDALAARVRREAALARSGTAASRPRATAAATVVGAIMGSGR